MLSYGLPVLVPLLCKNIPSSSVITIPFLHNLLNANVAYNTIPLAKLCSLKLLCIVLELNESRHSHAAQPIHHATAPSEWPKPGSTRLLLATTASQHDTMGTASDKTATRTLPTIARLSSKCNSEGFRYELEGEWRRVRSRQRKPGQGHHLSRLTSDPHANLRLSCTPLTSPEWRRGSREDCWQLTWVTRRTLQAV